MPIWSVSLRPTAARGPYTIRADDVDKNRTRQLEDVLFGDVYICSGQSNMVYMLEHVSKLCGYTEQSANFVYTNALCIVQEDKGKG